ncbi:MAG TPA: class I SAM-dependent methyltransferase [Trebonia sp.]|jgi:SAM-dependent methyltransferase|nr:class I SAM-dependent methyltransferase [Trebonia sp.]
MDGVTEANRQAWEAASHKHVREYDDLLAQAAAGSSLNAVERELLADILSCSPEVVHLQSGHGLDDAALVQAGAKSVTGVDYSAVAAGAAQRRADELGLACRYVVGTVPGVPLGDGTADLVYTGKGALIWLPDIDAWAREAARLLRPGGHLFLHEGHPAVPLWMWDGDAPRIRDDRSYFARSHVSDSFPARGATEWQHTLGQVVTAVITAGMEPLSLAEYPEPFWRPGGVHAAAWDGRLPNTYSLLARRPASTGHP